MDCSEIKNYLMGEVTMRKRSVSFIIVLLLIFSGSLTVIGKSIIEQHVADIHYDSIIVDSHVDTMSKVVDSTTWLPKTDIGENTPFDVDIAKAKAGGLDVPFMAAYTSGYYGNNARSISRTLALINALYWTEEENPEHLTITPTVEEITNAFQDNKMATVPTIEGAYSLEEHNAIELLHQYKDLGIKVLGFNWNYSNALGEGANRVYGDPDRTPSQGGLTELGEEVAAEMNKIGMVIDVSHMSRNTFWDVINVSEAPVIATHSGVNALRDHQRNLDDEQLKALAENGGVIGIVFYPVFVKEESPAYIKDVVDHIDHAVDLIGIDHVGIGSDFDGASMPADLKDSSELYKLTEELISREYSEEDIEKLLGKNTLRVLREVEVIGKQDTEIGNSGVTITPSYKMGEIVQSNTPFLAAEIAAEDDSEIDNNNHRIIVDGIAYEPNFNAETSTLSLQLTEPLNERFHVVTFEVATDTGDIKRETKIFYIYASAANMKRNVEYFKSEGEFSNDDAVRSLTTHLTAVDHYEQQGLTEKVVKHMEGFMQLLGYQKDNDLISEQAYNVLRNEAESLINNQ